MTNTKLRFEKNHVITIAVLCLSIAAGVGLVTNIGGLFLSPMAEELGTGRGNVSNTMSICNIIYAIAGMMLPKIIRTQNFKKVIIIASLVTVGATFLLSMSNALWQLYVLNAARGFATGLTTTVLSNVIINNWFFANTGFISSIAMCFSGLAGAVFSPLFGIFMNSFGWRTSYQIAAGLMLLLFIPFMLAPVNLTPEAVGARPYGERSEKKTAASASSLKVPAAVIVLLVVYASLGGFLNSMIQHFPGLAESNSLAVGSVMLSAAMISNTGGKLVMGSLIDRFGVRRSIIGMACFVSLGFLLLFTVSGSIYIAAAFILGFGYSLSTVGVSMLTREMVGQGRYGSIYPSIAMFTTIFYALGTSGVGYAYDAFQSYTPVLFVFLCAEAGIICCALLSGVLQRKYAGQ